MASLRIPFLQNEKGVNFDIMRICRSPTRIIQALGFISLLLLFYIFTVYNSTPSRNFIDFSNRSFLTTNLRTGMEGGLGNVLFELVTLLGISRTLDRIPFIHMNNSFALDVISKKITPFFPELMEQFYTLDQNILVETVDFHEKCCTFDDPEKLRAIPSKFLLLHGVFFQSVKYFDHIGDSVRKWLKLDDKIAEKAVSSMPEFVKNGFRICVHVRRTDFITVGMQVPSDEEFTRGAVEHLSKKYSEKSPAVVVFGDDPEWSKGVLEGLRNVHVVEGTTPIEDLATSRSMCEALLITATQSTFGFWLGYLAKPDASVYYSDTFIHTNSEDEFSVNDFFPSRWIKLRLKDTVLIEV